MVTSRRAQGTEGQVVEIRTDSRESRRWWYRGDAGEYVPGFRQPDYST
jgi:hypothetical protein